MIIDLNNRNNKVELNFKRQSIEKPKSYYEDDIYIEYVPGLIEAEIQAKVDEILEDCKKHWLEGTPITDLKIHLQSEMIWVFPKERFVTYEKSDESWCRFFRIGHEEGVIKTMTFPNVYVKDISGEDITFALSSEGIYSEESYLTC